MEIQLIRSATVRLRFGDRTFLIDPWFAARGKGFSYAGRRRSPLVGLPFSPEEILTGVDAVIVSHLHSDHFDSAARSALSRGIEIFCASRDAPAIREYGFEKVVEFETEVQLGDIRIQLTRGRHGPDEVLGEMGEVSGFLFQATGEPVLYWSGDTIICEEVVSVIDGSRPDVIVVHACGARWKGMGPLVMDERMTEATLRAAPQAQVVATHLDAVDHATASRASLRAHFAALPNLHGRLHIPEDGESISFRKGPVSTATPMA